MPGQDLDASLTINVLDEPGQGGACHVYAIEWTVQDVPGVESRPKIVIPFQDGPVKEAGVNGVSNEALLAIVIDRLQGFQNGPFATTENNRALHNCKFALEWLHKRTRERMERGVEGTNQK